MYKTEEIPNRKQRKYRVICPDGSVYISELSKKKAIQLEKDLNELYELRELHECARVESASDTANAESQRTESSCTAIRDGDLVGFNRQEFENFPESLRAQKRRDDLEAQERKRRDDLEAQERKSAFSAILGELDRLESVSKRDIRKAYLSGKNAQSRERRLDPETVDIDYSEE